MSHYTTTVRAICETAAGLTSDVGYNDVTQVLNGAWDKIFEAFPIYEEAHREILCKKILRHYYMDEIAFETVGLWKLELNTKMNEIMPQYNSLYKASADIINPLYNKNLHREYDGTSKGTNKDTRTDNLTDTASTTTTTTGTDTRTDNLTDTASATTTTTGTDTRTDNLTDTNGGSVTTKTDSKRTDALKTVTDNTSTSTTTSSANNNNSNENFTSDTPQGSLSDVKAGRYMTNANIGKSTGSTSGSDKNDTSSNNTVNNTGTVSNAGTDTVTDTRTLTKTGTVKNTSADDTTSNSTVSKTGTVKNTSADNTTSNSTVSKTGTVVTDGSDSRTDAHTETITGYEGSATYAELLKKYSNEIINIDLMIINELSGLFMQIW